MQGWYKSDRQARVRTSTVIAFDGCVTPAFTARWNACRLLSDRAHLSHSSRNEGESGCFQRSPRHRPDARVIEGGRPGVARERCGARRQAEMQSKLQGLLRRHPGISRAKIIFVTVGVFLLWQSWKPCSRRYELRHASEPGPGRSRGNESRFFAGRGHAGD